MDINTLTIGEVKEIAAMVGCSKTTEAKAPTAGLSSMLGKKVIIRTNSAGVFFGTLSEKDGTEVILTDARRLWKWHAAKSISLSGVAKYGLNGSGSKVAPALESIWLDVIEIIPCTSGAIASIESQPDVEAS
jgi:hypothetical protein